MAGHMGSGNATVKNSVVIAVDQEHNLLTVKGGVPGHPQAKVKVYLTEDKLPLTGIVHYKKEEPKQEAAGTEPKAEEIKPEETPPAEPSAGEAKA